MLQRISMSWIIIIYWLQDALSRGKCLCAIPGTHTFNAVQRIFSLNLALAKMFLQKSYSFSELLKF